MADTGPARIDAGSALLIGALGVTLVAGFVVLTVTGVSTTAYVLFVSGPIVSTIVGAVLSAKVAKVDVKVAKVERQTDGIFTATVAAVQDHLTEQDVTAAAVATEATDDRQRHAETAPGSPLSDERPVP